MALKPPNNADAASELPWTSAEGTPVSEHIQTPRLNGSISQMDASEDHAIVAFLRSYGPVILAAAFGVVGSLAAAGFVAQPATKTSVDELKNTVTVYIDNHEKLDAIRTETLSKDLKEVNASLRDLLDRSRLEEIHQAKLEAKVEDIIRILAIPPVTPPPSSAYDPPKSVPSKPVLRAH